MTSQRIGMVAWTFLFALLLIAAPATLLADDEVKSIAIAEVKHDGPVDFEKEILPIFRRKCLACHNATEAESDLVLETPELILKGGSEGPAAIAGKGNESLLLKLAARQMEPVMPPDDNDVGAKNLTSQELGLLKLWIDQGAKGSVASMAGPVNWQPLPPGVNPIYAVAISPDGQYAAAGRANQIFIYHVPTKREVGRLTDPSLAKDRPGVAHLDLIQSLTFSRDNQRLASGGYRNVKLWRRSENVQLASLAGLEGPSRSMAVSADGKWVAIGEESGKIKLIDLATKKLSKTLVGHSAAVTAVCFSADGSRLVSGSQDKTFRIFNTSDGKQIGVETPSAVNAVAIVAGGKQIATGGADGVIRTWQFLSADAKPDQPAAPIKEIKGHGGPVTSLAAVLPAGDQLVSGSQDGTVRIWNVAAGSQVRSINHGGPVTAVAVRIDGQRIASSSANNTAKLWNIADGKLIAELKGDFHARIKVDEATRAVELAKRNVASAKKDLDDANKRKKAEEDNQKKADEALKKAIAELDKKDEAAKKPLADKATADKALADANAAVAKAESDQKASVADIAKATEALKKAQADLAAASKAISDSAAATKLAAELLKTAQAALAKDAANKELTAVVAAAEKLAKETAAKSKAASDKKIASEKMILDTTAKIKAAEAAKKLAGQQLAAAKTKVKAADANVKKLAAAAKKATDEKVAAERTRKAATRSVDRAKQLVQKATAAVPGFEAALKKEEATAKQIDAQLAKVKQSATDSEKPLSAVAFSPDGSTLATGGADSMIHTWDSETGVAIESIGPQTAPIVAMGFTAEGNVLAAQQNGSATIWDAHVRWTLERTIGSVDSSETLIDRVTSLAFSPDGLRIAAGGGEPSRSGELKIFNVSDGSLSLALKEPHSDTVFGLEFSPDGKVIASCAADRFVKCFDTGTGKFIRSFEGHTHHVLGVSWRADGRVLASCGADNVIKVWNYLTGDQTRTITGFSKEVTSIGFVGVSDNVLASSGDKTVAIKRTDNGGNIRTFAGGGDFMYSARSSGDGKTILAGGQDSVLRVWDASGKVIVTFEAPPRPQQTASSGNSGG